MFIQIESEKDQSIEKERDREIQGNRYTELRVNKYIRQHDSNKYVYNTIQYNI